MGASRVPAIQARRSADMSKMHKLQEENTRKQNEWNDFADRVSARMKARKMIEKERGTPWDKERKELDSAICAWKTEEFLEESQRDEMEKDWDRGLKSAIKSHRDNSQEVIRMLLEREANRNHAEEENTKKTQARMVKFTKLEEAEANRWEEELSRAATLRTNQTGIINGGGLGSVHRSMCIPSDYISGERDKFCEDCEDDEKMVRLTEKREAAETKSPISY
ncbi:hypothetical protein SBOR_6782 [Sclerotinia borealis F-4128]|uniref:Uncharacterized protein n=1 Tax=Sclerotinia borealis (strain F-4128) TaxID=1432307 RepID=W9CAL8_SCLBF|nr:hypothetical protein SBOR_6782 [Sclerotinia borealis F-4128]